MHNLIFILLASAGAFAHGPDFARQRCEPLLGVTVAELGEQPVDIRFKNRPGIGNRGLVAGAWPPVTGAAEAAAHRQGVISWYHTIGVARSVEEARRDDERRIHYRQIMYLITDHAVDDLEPSEAVGELFPEVEAARLHRAADRFAEIFDGGRTRVVYFEDPPFDPEIHERGALWVGHRQIHRRGDPEPHPRILREVPVEHARAAFHADEMGFIKDYDGARFLQYGWFRLPRRGISDFETSFARNPGGSTPKSSFIKEAYNLALALVAEGWTFRISHDIEDAFDLELRTTHGVNKLSPVPGGTPLVNSRYAKAHVRAMTREAFANGDAFTFELRDPQGVLRASEIGFYGPNSHIIMDCISGMDAPKDPSRKLGKKEKPIYLGIELRKAVIAAGIVWARSLGYPFTDSIVVSEFSEKAKTYYLDIDPFLDAVHAWPSPPRAQRGEFWMPPPYAQLYRDFVHPEDRRPGRRPRILP